MERARYMALQQDVGGITYPPALPTPEIEQPPTVPIRPSFTRVSATRSSQASQQDIAMERARYMALQQDIGGIPYPPALPTPEI